MNKPNFFRIAAVLMVSSGLIIAAGCTDKGTDKPGGDTDGPKNVENGGTPSPGSTTKNVYDLVIPVGLEPLDIPVDNPLTQAKIDLGKILYFDTRLSKDGTISCATCHDPKNAWAEPTATSTGIAGQIGDRNSPTILNSAYFESLFWDGRSPSLEHQALGPIENPIEMGHDLQVVVDQLSKIPGYQVMFEAAFNGEGVSKQNIAKAIASFERTLLSGNSPYDRKEMDESAQRGEKLFTKAGCQFCHAQPLFGSDKFHNIGIGTKGEKPDPGRQTVSLADDDRDWGKFRVPTLRNVALTGPYFHDGKIATLEEAVNIMASGGIENHNISPMLKKVKDAKLTDQDKADLTAFLKALTGDIPQVEAPEMPK